MSDKGETLRVPAVRFHRWLPGPIEQVWARLTDCGKLAGWYGEGALIEPREGGAVRLSGGHIRGVVTQWRPPVKLAHTWNVFAGDETQSAYPESYVTFELSQSGDAVGLALFHLPVLERFEAQNQMGWHTMLDILEAVASGQTPEPRQTYMERNAARYGVDLNALIR